MGKNVGLNTKAVEAKAKKDAAAAGKKAKVEQESDDAQWRDDGGKSKAAKKKEEDAEKKAEAARKKAEAKKLAEAEEAELNKIAKKGTKPVAPKVTAAELAKQKEKEEQARAKASEEATKKTARMVDESEYDRLVNVENTNRVEALVDARSLTDAVEQLSVGEGKAADPHPEKRLKASYKAYEEQELAALKQERPGMTLTQYKDLIWKSWKKSPQNPLNQASGSS